jgi:outer membrane protein TolC
MIALVLPAYAITLEQTVARAVEVDPTAVVAELEWRQARLDAAERWSALAVQPEVRWERARVGPTVVSEQRTRVTVPVADVSGWFDAAQHAAEARVARGASEATTLDAQYAAATLFFEVLIAQRAEDLAARSLAETESTLEVARARVTAGLEPALHAQAAEAHVVRARADLSLARTGVRNARARLARAVLTDIDTAVETPLPPPPPDPGSRSPWIDAADAAIDAARFEHVEAWAELIPVGELEATSQTGLPDWNVTLRGTWSIDGIGPVIRARRAALEQRKATAWRDGLTLDLALAADTGAAQSVALGEVAEAARAQEILAQSALDAGRAQLRVGLIDALDVVQLQDNLLDARRDRIEAELDQLYAVMEARRTAGARW